MILTEWTNDEIIYNRLQSSKNMLDFCAAEISDEDYAGSDGEWRLADSFKSIKEILPDVDAKKILDKPFELAKTFDEAEKNMFSETLLKIYPELLRRVQAELSDIYSLSLILNDLVKEIDGLTELFLEESKDFQDFVKRLTELKAGIEKDCAVLSKFAGAEATARQKLLTDVHEKMTEDAQKIIDDLSEPLNATNAELQKTCKEIEDFIALHKKSQEKFLSDTENLLIKYNTKNLETYNNLLASLSNKITLATGTLEKLLANQDNRLAELSRKTDQNKL